MRFAAERSSPYKTHIGIRFPIRSIRQDTAVPQFYLHLQPDKSFCAAGLWHPDNRTLQAIRSYIAQNPTEWQRISGDLRLRGRSLTGVPRGFPQSHPLITDLQRKDFVISKDVSDSEVVGPFFLRSFVDHCFEAAPLMCFLGQAVRIEQHPKSVSYLGLRSKLGIDGR